jgi:GT2 family glycosyltransferase
MYDSMRDHVEAPVETRWLGAGNLVVRRSAFEDIGGFDETLEACEDVDLCRARLRSSGARLINTPRMVNRHFGDPATLRALFKGELWRGRDNLRVSLRGPVSWRDLPSVVVPVLWLVVTALSVVALWVHDPQLSPASAAIGLCVLGLAQRCARGRA